jgi:NAD(P)-dependent dehydrogenase (short-subunit alcohol dehydrogenase family)
VNDLTGKVAVVTGAASGIGLALATAFASQHMKLVLADIEERPLHDAEQSLRSGGAEVIAVATDVAQQAHMERLAKATVDTFGAVHVVCNNAGVSLARRAPIWEASTADWQWMLNVNVWSVIHGIRAFVPILVEQDEGHVVNTASIAGLIPGVLGVYSVTKHAVVALSEALQLQLAERHSRVAVSVVCPGWVKTRIGEAERNRPDAVPVVVDDDVAARRRALVATGTPPSFVADSVLDAIRSKRFYILPHPEWISLVTTRAKDIATGSPPRTVDLGTVQHARLA